MFNKAKASIGLEINNKSIKILELKLHKDERIISANNEVDLEPGIIERGVIKKPKELARQLKLAFKTAKPHSIKTKTIHFALPNDLAYVHVFRANVEQGQGIKQVVNSEYQRSIPFSLKVGELSFKLIDKHESFDQTQVSTIILVAAKQKDLLFWQDFFESQNLKIDFFDIEALAIFRGMFTEHQDKTFGFLDIKQSYSKFFIFSSHGLEYETTLNIGSEELEEEKKADLKILVSEVDKSLNRASKLIMGNGEDKLKIDEIILSGGCRDIDNLTRSLNNFNLDYKFSLKSPVIVESKIDRKYFQSLGLAMRNFSHYWEKSDPFLPCIGHVYELEKSKGGDGVELKEVLIFFKKYILLPIVVLIIVSFVWWFLGAVQTSLEGENKEQTETIEPIKRELPLYMRETEEPPKEIFIKINEIGGPLNVRGGPSTSYSVIGQVDSSSEQVFIEEKDGWYNIEWPNNDSAWISAAYAKKID